MTFIILGFLMFGFLYYMFFIVITLFGIIFTGILGILLFLFAAALLLVGIMAAVVALRFLFSLFRRERTITVREDKS